VMTARGGKWDATKVRNVLARRETIRFRWTVTLAFVAAYAAIVAAWEGWPVKP
jgi:hypothetical protein